MNSDTPLQQLFLEAMQLAADGYLAEAAIQFKKGAELQDPDLSDDCLVNAGICSMQIGMLDEAIRLFRQEITEYPGSLLSNSMQKNELGETSAKSHYGILQCLAAQGKLEQARAELDALRSYDGKAWVETAEGNRLSYAELGEQFLESLTGSEAPVVTSEEQEHG